MEDVADFCVVLHFKLGYNWREPLIPFVFLICLYSLVWILASLLKVYSSLQTLLTGWRKYNSHCKMFFCLGTCKCFFTAEMTK